jgi:hypothetical protein
LFLGKSPQGIMFQTSRSQQNNALKVTEIISIFFIAPRATILTGVRARHQLHRLPNANLC